MKLFYREKGQTSLPTLIILHGLWGASDNWLPVAEKLSADFHVLLPDLRNHGHSPHEAEHSYAAMAKDIQEWIEELHLPAPPFIAGHSMGGKCLMYMLLQYPGIATKAAIIDIAPQNYEQTEEHLQIIRFIKEFAFKNEENRASLHLRIRNNIKEEHLCQIILKNIDKDNKGFKWRMNVQAILEYLPNIMGWELLTNKCSTPTLFIRGEKSNYLQTENIPNIKDAFPCTSILTINGAGHRIHAQKPDELAEALKHFFDVSTK